MVSLTDPSLSFNCNMFTSSLYPGQIALFSSNTRAAIIGIKFSHHIWIWKKASKATKYKKKSLAHSGTLTHNLEIWYTLFVTLNVCVLDLYDFSACDGCLFLAGLQNDSGIWTGDVRLSFCRPHLVGSTLMETSVYEYDVLGRCTWSCHTSSVWMAGK